MTLAQSRLPWFAAWTVALTLALMFAAHAAFAQNDTPDTKGASDFISTLADDTMKVLQGDQSESDKKASFGSLLEKGVNTQYVSRFVLGRNWNTATPEQRQEFEKLFKEYLLASLTSRLGGEYQSQSFTVTNATPAGSRDVLVNSQIQRQSGPPVTIEWRVRQFDGQWQIIDIKAEGLSLAITQRQEYGSVIQRRGMDGLLSALRKQVNKLQQGDTDAELPPS